MDVTEIYIQNDKKICPRCENIFRRKSKTIGYCNDCFNVMIKQSRETLKTIDYICECGLVVSHLSQWVHKKTKKHENRMNRKNKIN